MMSWTDNAVGGTDTPKVLYHATSHAAWPKIRVQGLRAGRPRWKFGGEPDGVYLYQRRDWAERHPDNGGGDNVILKVRVKGLVLVGNAWAGIFVHEGDIPARRISKA
jgi:hypothetical protein